MNATTRHGLFLLAAVILDQVTKAWADAALAGRGIVEIVPGYFDLRLSHNRGAFFSIGSTLPDSVRVGLFVVATLITLAMMVALYRKTAPEQAATRFGLVLLAAGGVGNLIDRVRYGEVTDFLHLHLREVFHWATFNVADVWITAGLCILVVTELLPARTRAQNRASQLP